jgi:hypothetical protein
MNEKNIRRKQIIEKLFTHQQAMIDNLKAAMEESQQAANDYGSPKDRYDSFRTQLLRKRDMFAQQLQLALDDNAILKRIPIEKEFEKIEFGAIVITKSQKLIISASLGKIDVEGELFYAISVKVPFFAVINGLKKGDNFTFNNQSNTIIDIY